MSRSFTVSEIAAALKIKKRSVRRRAEREGWKYEKGMGTGKGRKPHLYPFDDLPEDVQMALSAWAGKQEQHALIPSNQTLSPSSSKEFQHELCAQQVIKANFKFDLLRRFIAMREKASRGRKGPDQDELLLAYNTGLAYPKLFEIIGEVKSIKTVQGWERKLNKHGGDPLCLADTRGHTRRGSCCIPYEVERIFIKIALDDKKPLISEVIRRGRAVMKTKNIFVNASDETIRNRLNDWKSRNYDTWVWARHGHKAWNDKVAFFIERNYDLINVGDILVCDGHRLNFEIISPWTGKPTRMVLILWYDMKSNFPVGWAIVPTENTAGIHLALARAVLRLGKFPKAAYLDNGKAFRAKFFNSVNFEESGISGLYARLDIETIFAWSYHGQSKTVERFFKTFAEFERIMPTYIGTSIDKQPPRLNRGEKRHRAIYEKKMRGRGITLEMAYRAVAFWFDEYAKRHQRGHLQGKTPLEVFAEGRGPGVDRKELRDLLMSYEIKKIDRSVISFRRRRFFSQALYGRKHPVILKYDIHDLSSVYVYEKSGEFICEAFQTDKNHPAASALGNDKDRALLKQQIELKRSQEKQTRLSARDHTENEILPEYLERNGITLDLPFKREEVPEIPYQTEEEIAEEMRQIEEYQPPKVKPIFTGKVDRYQWVLDRKLTGNEISLEDQAFMQEYESNMDPDTQQYWQIYKDSVSAPKDAASGGN